jgi:hypothetical protein
MKLLRQHTVPILGILIAVGFLFLANYSPGTHLMGWDNIQTDLYPSLGVKRAFFSAWEEYQSFGLLAGMAHGADLIRALFVGFLGLFLPDSLARYAFHMLMVVVGALGMYRLLVGSFAASRVRPFQGRTSALLGSLFYILNYGVIQLMSVPWEAFSVFIGFLPWLVWICIRYISARGKTNAHLVWLFLINLLATPFAYIQTLFVVYMLIIGAIGVGLLFEDSHLIWLRLRRFLVAVLVIVCVHAFWLLPQVYFVFTGGPSGVQHAKINQLATDDVMLNNKAYGSSESFAKFEGFYTGLENWSKGQLFGPWSQHFSNPVAGALQWLFFGLVLYGIFQKSRYRKVFVGVFALGALGLLSNIPGFASMNEFVRRWPLIGEMFRSPFTKFTTIYALAASYFLAVGAAKLGFVQGPTLKRSDLLRARWVLPALLIGLILYSLPAFRGHYFASDMHVTIPQDYLDTINYFQQVDHNQRIALMPEYTFWGWYFTDWGYNGSGFLWYGIEQPIVSRTFDVWSPVSEGYFWEMKAALEAEDVGQMEEVLEKYAIDYVIVDHSLQPVSSGARALQYDRLSRMLGESSRLHQFGFGDTLSLYRFKRTAGSNGFVSLAGDMPTVGPDVSFIPGDISDIHVPYIATDTLPEKYYPFRNLTSQTRLFDDQWALKEYENAFILIGRAPGENPADLAKYSLDIPIQETQTELYIDGKPQTLTQHMTFELNKEQQTLSVTIPKTLIRTLQPKDGNIYDCSKAFLKKLPDDVQVTQAGESLRVYSNNGTTPCIGYEMPYLSQKYGYMLSVQTRTVEGRGLFMAITDKTKGQGYVEDRLLRNNELFMIGPRFEYGQGYTATFQNTSHKGIPSTNVIDALNIYAFPYEALRQIRFVRQDMRHDNGGPGGPFTAPASVHKRAYHAYTIDLTAQEHADNKYLILHQAYHPGWKGYVVAHDPLSQYFPFLAGRVIPDDQHIKVNGWAQGWQLPATCERGSADCRIVLVFWPQYLQWVGFGLMAGIVGWILLRSRD